MLGNAHRVRELLEQELLRLLSSVVPISVMPCSRGITLHIKTQPFVLVFEMTNQENWNYRSSEGPVQHVSKVAGPSEF
jgi:hypothetical protein